MIQTIILISAASLGFRAITGKGMIFYFLRQPFDRLKDRKEDIEKLIAEANETEKAYREIVALNIKDYGEDHRKTDMYKEHQGKILAAKTIRVLSQSPTKYDWVIYIMKPAILCSTCMASVHTLIWWPFLVGAYSWQTVFTMLCVAFLNTLLYGLIELIQKK